MKDYYTILGVSENSSKQEINKAFKEKVRKYHPDLCGKNTTPEQKEQNEKTMMEINEAYNTLKDETKKLNLIYP